VVLLKGKVVWGTSPVKKVAIGPDPEPILKLDGGLRALTVTTGGAWPPLFNSRW
jgi:hypothetical protein